MAKKVRWGILSPAKIGVEKVIPAMQKGALTEVVAIASRDLTRAEAAKFLRISVDGLDKILRENSDFPRLKVGRRFLFQPEKLIEWACEQGAAAH